jgi:hypothetical protein
MTLPLESYRSTSGICQSPKHPTEKYLGFTWLPSLVVPQAIEFRIVPGLLRPLLGARKPQPEQKLGRFSLLSCLALAEARQRWRGKENLCKTRIEIWMYEIWM